MQGLGYAGLFIGSEFKSPLDTTCRLEIDKGLVLLVLAIAANTLPMRVQAIFTSLMNAC